MTLSKTFTCMQTTNTFNLTMMSYSLFQVSSKVWSQNHSL